MRGPEHLELNANDLKRIDKIKLKKGLVLRQEGSVDLLYDKNVNKIYELNKLASKLLEKISVSNHIDVDETSSELAMHYNTSTSRIKKDVVKFLIQCLDLGILREDR